MQTPNDPLNYSGYTDPERMIVFACRVLQHLADPDLDTTDAIDLIVDAACCLPGIELAKDGQRWIKGDLPRFGLEPAPKAT